MIKNITPNLLILLGLFILFIIGIAPVAFALLILGFVMIIVRIWPEEWDTNSIE